jgi:phosphoglycolate phosphatase-like HAD superfamily hydrolase
MTGWAISGRVTAGAGKGAAYTCLAWAREQFVEKLGIDPFPGTLNLHIQPGERESGEAARLSATVRVRPPGEGCSARCLPVRVCDRVPAAVVWPDVSDYPADRLELIAAVSLRELFALQDGDEVTITSGAAMPVRAAVFDVDGTLVNSIEGMRLAADQAAGLYGYRVSLDMVRRALNYGESLWEMVVPEGERIDEELPGVLRRETWRRWPGVVDTCVNPFEGIEHTLRRRRDAGVRLAIYTGSRGESFAPLERAGLLDWFDPVITAADVTRPKPDPEGLLRILEAVGAAPRDAAYVGDTRHDVLAGRAAGMRTVGVLTGAADSAILTMAGVDHLVADHRGLADVLLGTR